MLEHHPRSHDELREERHAIQICLAEAEGNGDLETQDRCREKLIELDIEGAAIPPPRPPIDDAL